MDNLNNKDYQKYAKNKVPKPTYLKNIILAFIVGGIICTVGQLISHYFTSKGLDIKMASAATAIFISSPLLVK